MDKHTFFGLLDRYLAGTASPAEAKLLEEYYRRLETGELPGFSAEEEQTVKEKMYRVISAEISRPVVRSVFKLRRIAVAASILLTIGIGAYFVFLTPRAPKAGVPGAASLAKDIPPGRDAAVLTLADGRQILLDSASGTISTDNGVTVINLNGQLSYQGQTTGNEEPVYNTVTTARGNQYQLVLSDGSKVWLNSASSLRYPTQFSGGDRSVELSGEGYFEIAHNPAMPFRVKTGKQTVEVLGTHFNINSYNDEDAVRTTLLEGSVKINSGEKNVVLKPGQQGILAGDQLNITSSIDIEKIMAWKNGWFEFDQLDLATIMRQVSRWYDVDIVYEGKLTSEKFGGRLSKNLPLSAVIEMMKASGVVCTLNGKTLKVQP